jgi:excisionase family DNA binding protein
MTTLLDTSVVPTPHDAELAARASRALSALRQAESDLRVRLDDGQVLTLPRAAARLLQHLLAEMAQGNAVTLIPVHAELSTQEAADFLHVSRPFLVRLLDAGDIPCRMVGAHRRVKFLDLEKYSREAEARRQKAMSELAAQAEELDMET